MFRRTSPFFSKSTRHYATHVFHLTDVEGSSAFFTAIKNSNMIRWHSKRGLEFKTNSLGSKPYFIFGGDATDRGHHDLAITEALVDFKERHPENVILLVGNREIKNTRFTIELAPEWIRERLLDGKAPSWLPEHKRTIPLDYVMKAMAKEGVDISFINKEKASDYVHSLSIPQCQLIYLHWMLEKTMGCPHTFRYRREELAQRLNKAVVSDETVLESFLKESSPQGLMGRYLQQAEVGTIVPNTGILALHGGITLQNLGRVPNMASDASPLPSAKFWINQYNHWYKEQIQTWAEIKPSDLPPSARTTTPEVTLALLNKPTSLITADMLDKDYQFTDVPSSIGRYLKNNGIQLVLTGHQPCGQHPALLRDDKHAILYINGDTSYATYDPKNPDDTRGPTHHVLEITASPHETDVTLQATLPNAMSVITKMKITPDSIKGDPHVGRLLPDSQTLVQHRLPNGDYHCLTRRGYQSSTLSSREVETLLGEAPKALFGNTPCI
jgi:hypothetical protein